MGTGEAYFRCTVRKWRRSRPLRRRGRSTEERLSMRNDLLLTHPGLFPDAVRREVSWGSSSWRHHPTVPSLDASELRVSSSGRSRPATPRTRRTTSQQKVRLRRLLMSFGARERHLPAACSWAEPSTVHFHSGARRACYAHWYTLQVVR